MKKHLTVRPKIYSDECLTSIIMRYAEANSLRCEEIFDMVRSCYKRADIRNAHHIDINPFRVLNFSVFQTLLKVKSDKLTNSFYPALSIFVDSEELGTLNNSSTLIKGLFITKTRRFCNMCVEEKSYYKLIWQIKNILYCPEHNIPLSSNCPNCGNEQPYIHEDFYRGICYYCKKTLSLHEKRFNDELSYDYSNWLYKQWVYLMSYNNKPFVNLHENIIRLLYLCNTKCDNFTVENLKFISRDYKYKLLKILSLNNTETYDEIGLNIIFKILFLSKLDVEEFLELNVSSQFRISLRKYVSKKSNCYCLAPWCSHFGTNKELKKLKYRSKTHNNLHICLGCTLKYGINKDTGQWVEYGEIISIGYNILLPLINSGMNKINLSKVVNSRYKVYKMASYLAKFNLINNTYIKNFTPQITDISTAHLLKIASNNETKMRKRAKETLHLGIGDFYFYYFSYEVQRYIYNS